MEWFSEDINITNFSKILLKFAIVFKIFEYFSPFLSLTILNGQRRFLSFGLHDKYSETNNVFEHFLYRKLETFLYFLFLLSFLNSFVDAALQRLLRGMMSSSITLISSPINPAKTYLTKQLLGADEANPSPVV